MTSRILLLHDLSQHIHQASIIAQSLHIPVLAYLVNMAKLEILNQIKEEYLANDIQADGDARRQKQ
jgi:hypothetical protein